MFISHTNQGDEMEKVKQKERKLKTVSIRGVSERLWNLYTGMCKTRGRTIRWQTEQIMKRELAEWKAGPE